jgi:hypothetical protein
MGRLTDPKLVAKFETLLEYAPKLREAGVLEVDVDELHVRFAPAVGPGPEPEDDEEDPELEALNKRKARGGVLDDPATFGRRESLPGRRKGDDE